MRSLKKASQIEAIGQSFVGRWLRKRLVLAGYRKMSLSSIQIYGCRLQRVQQH